MSGVAALIVDRAGRKPLLMISTSVLSVSLIAIGYYFHQKDGGNDVSSLGWLPLVSLIIFMVAFSIGWVHAGRTNENRNNFWYSYRVDRIEKSGSLFGSERFEISTEDVSMLSGRGLWEILRISHSSTVEFYAEYTDLNTCLLPCCVLEWRTCYIYSIYSHIKYCRYYNWIL